MKSIKTFIGLADYQFSPSILACVVALVSVIPDSFMDAALLFGLSCVLHLIFPATVVMNPWIAFVACWFINSLLAGPSIISFNGSAPTRFAFLGLFRKELSPEEAIKFNEKTESSEDEET